jgi:hypothetical protein
VTTTNRALRQYYEEQGAWEHHRYCGGYELGIAFPPDWVGEFIFNVADENAEGHFENNSVTNYESHLRNENGGARFPLLAFSIDTILYSSTGNRRLSAIPPGLIVLGNT